MEFLSASQRIKIFLGGRGVGKSTVIAGEDRLRMAEMPRAKFFLSSTTYAQILTKTLPAMESKWQEMGFVEGIHYVVGKRPPKHFWKTLSPPRKFENTITFCNGYCRELLSMDRPDLARGGSYQGGDVDEAALVQQVHFTKVMLPAVRGYRHHFNSPRYGMVNLYTSVPWKPSGYWILDYEEKAKADPERYFFLECSTMDNIEVLGLDYVEMLRAELPYLEFLVEVMNQRVRKTPDAFYHKFDPELHAYKPIFEYGEGERGITIRREDARYKATELLNLSMDFGGWFNCGIVFQEGRDDRRIVERGLRQFFKKDGDGKVAELVDDIADHYRNHEFKLIRLWGEPRGHDRRPDNDRTIYEQVRDRFIMHGWKVEICVKAGQVRGHKERNFYMNDVLGEQTQELPILRLNETTCKDAIIAMQVTNMKPNFEKNKKNEADRAYPQEHAPHFTDAIDYYLMQKHGHRIGGRNRPALGVSIR